MADPIFDTCIIVDWLSGHEQAAIELERYQRHRISRVSWTEILAGEQPASRDVVQSLIAPFEVVEVDMRISAAAAEIRHNSGMHLLDATILATAQVSGAILVTRNTVDFPASLPGIRVPYTL